MLLSVSMIIHLAILFMCFIASSYSQINTINKACATDDSTCGAGQICVNGRCECDPNERRFWTGDKYQCRVCPKSYNRLPSRCYKYYSTIKNHSDARADCRKDQADLFSWRDNTDENELITASTAQWNNNNPSVKIQLYSWSGGMVYHGRGSKAEYKITWFDPKGPAMYHPDMNDPLSDRYCNGMTMANYEGDPEPTRLTKKGETENCISFVFLAERNSRGHICMADDYCSTKMSYICELTDATISGMYQTPPTPPTGTNTITDVPGGKSPSSNEPPNVNNENTPRPQVPLALTEDEEDDQFNIVPWAIGGVLCFAIIGVVAFIFIRKRKQNNENQDVSPANSTASSNMADADIYQNA